MASIAEIRQSEPVARASAIAEIRTLLGERLSTASAVRDQHGRGEAYHHAVPPDAVAFVESTAEAAAAGSPAGLGLDRHSLQMG